MVLQEDCRWRPRWEDGSEALKIPPSGDDAAASGDFDLRDFITLDT